MLLPVAVVIDHDGTGQVMKKIYLGRQQPMHAS
jgi:hypothetical protein